MEYYSEPCSGDDEKAEAPAGMSSCEYCDKGFRLHGACFCTECLIELRELMWRGTQRDLLSAAALQRYVRLKDAYNGSYMWAYPEVTRERAEREAAILDLTYEKYMEPACMRGAKEGMPTRVVTDVDHDEQLRRAIRYDMSMRTQDQIAGAVRYTNGTGGGMVVSSTAGSYTNNVTSQFTSFYMS